MISRLSLERFAAGHGGLVSLPLDGPALADAASRGHLRDTLSSLAREGSALRIERGTYVFPSPNGGPQPLAIGSRLGGPGAYVSLAAAAEHYGLVTSATSAIAVVAGGSRASLAVPELGCSFHFYGTTPDRLFGARRESVGAVVAEIASPERLLIDLLWFDPGPAMPPIHEILAAWEAGARLRSLNPRLLASYAVRMRSGRLVRRVGFLMEHFGYPGHERLLEHTGSETNRIALLPGAHVGWRPSPRWRVDPAR